MPTFSRNVRDQKYGRAQNGKWAKGDSPHWPIREAYLAYFSPDTASKAACRAT